MVFVVILRKGRMGTGTKINIKLKAHLKGHNGGIYSLAKGDDSHFYTAGADGWIAKWDPSKSEDGELVAQCEEPLYTLLHHENNLYAGSSHGHIFILTPGKDVRKIEAHTRGVFFIKSLNNGFISGGGDGKLMVWNGNMEWQKTLQLSPQSLRTCLINENKITVAGSEGTLFFLKDTLENIQSIKAHKNSIFALCAIGDQLISGGRDAELRFWESDQMQQHVPAHLLHIHGLSSHPSLPIFASASMDKTCKIWTADGELLKVLNAEKFGGHINSVNACLWLNQSTLITVSDDKTCMVYILEKV